MRVSSILDDLVKEYSGKVRVVYKNMVVHPQVVTDAHLATCAASKQHKFLEFKHAVWEKGFEPYSKSGGRDKDSFSEANLLKMGQDLGLNVDQLKSDMHGDECKARLKADEDELSKFHVHGTPAFFINGKHIGGGIPKEAFQKIIDEKLKVAEASGVSGAEYYEKEIMGKGEHQFKGAGAEAE
jgi:protein-disulfide isomerase